MKLRSFSRSMRHALFGLLIFGAMSESVLSMQAGWVGGQPSGDGVWWFRGFWWIAAGLVGIFILSTFHPRYLALRLLLLLEKAAKVCGIRHPFLIFFPGYPTLLRRHAVNRLHLRYLLTKRWVIHKRREFRVKFLPNVERMHPS